MAKGIMLTPEQQLKRRHEIKNVALQLFKEKGFQKTSMREISEVVGMGKSSLYDFFASKDEIVVFAHEEAVRTFIEKAKELVASEATQEQCLRIIMRNNLAYTKENKHLILWLYTEASYLDEPYQKRFYLHTSRWRARLSLSVPPSPPRIYPRLLLQARWKPTLTYRVRVRFCLPSSGVGHPSEQPVRFPVGCFTALIRSVLPLLLLYRNWCFPMPLVSCLPQIRPMATAAKL